MKLPIRREVQAVQAAAIFLTRLPLAPSWEFSQNVLNHAAKYFPLIGLVLGCILAGSAYGLNLIYHPFIAVVLTMALHIWITGGFHEDGFADACDAFGGAASQGWQTQGNQEEWLKRREEVLRIMHDSHVGTYGVLGLIILFFLKATSLAFQQAYLAPAWILGQSVSRLVPVIAMFFLPYIRGQGKSKPVAQPYGLPTLIIASILGLGAVPFMPWHLIAGSVLALLASAVAILRLHHSIGGYTGDALGALQQFSELLLYLTSLGLLGLV